MKLSARRIVVAATTLAFTSSLLAVSRDAIGDIVKAQILINKALEIVQAYREATVVLVAPEPMAGSTGKYLLPYRADGEMTEWAGRTIQAQAGKVVGEKAGGMASNALAAKIPFGGLAGGFMKKKTKEFAGVTALGGMDYLKKTSDLSYDNLNDYVLYLHVRHSGDANYKEALAAAMVVYPDLEGQFDGIIKHAYQVQAGKKTGQ